MSTFTLPARLQATVRALVPVVCTDAAQRMGIVEDVADGVERFLGTLPGHLQKGILAGLWTLELTPAADPRNLGRTFSRLRPERAQKTFDLWWHLPGPTHQLARALKMFVSFAFYEHPKMRERLGYDPEAYLAQMRRKRLAEHADAIAAHTAKVLAPNPVPRTLPVVVLEEGA
ncbi:MAG: hypothetical protein KDD82_10450 [Planctomycetes bacterium]|nr:hypothetical protein [Planctomycetota bacterium]